MSALRLECLLMSSLPADDDFEDVGSSTVGVASVSALKLEDVSVCCQRVF